MTSPRLDRLALNIVQGKRFVRPFRWGTPVKVYKQITALPSLTPAQLTVTGHGLPDGWPFRVTGVNGPEALNNRWHWSRVIDANTIEINAVNLAGSPAYISGGFIEYYTPVDLAGILGGRVVLKETAADADPELELNVTNGMLKVDNAKKLITFDIPGSVSAGMQKYAGTWDWEMTMSDNSILDPRGDLPALPRWSLVREGAT